MKYIKTIESVEWAKPPIPERTMFVCDKCKTTAYFSYTIA